ncbi:hypothetical protein T484DRAFT_2833154 [Baffinella frigidus]|nr:hypothetical protein T484DRAFT_2833154 [Cryptophyta sp. CCMP2293]
MVSRDAGECQRKCAELKNNFAATAAGMETDTSLEFQKSKDEALKGHGSRSGKGVRTSGTAIISDREIDREGTTHFKPKDTAGEEEDDDEPDFFGDPVNVTGKTAAGKKDAKKDPAEDWSVDEQKALEAAMAEFKTSKLDVKEKWKAIADRVPGRTDKDCVKRVKHIQSMLKK